MKYIFIGLLSFIYLIGDILFDRGNVKYFCNYFTEAIKDFDTTINLGDNNVTTYHYRGLAKIFLVLFKDAILDFNKVFVLEPMNAEILFSW